MIFTALVAAADSAADTELRIARDSFRHAAASARAAYRPVASQLATTASCTHRQTYSRRHSPPHDAPPIAWPDSRPPCWRVSHGHTARRYHIRQAGASQSRAAPEAPGRISGRCPIAGYRGSILAAARVVFLNLFVHITHIDGRFRHASSWTFSSHHHQLPFSSLLLVSSRHKPLIYYIHHATITCSRITRETLRHDDFQKYMT